MPVGHRIVPKAEFKPAVSMLAGHQDRLLSLCYTQRYLPIGSPYETPGASVLKCYTCNVAIDP
jgi:hypothetical protein